MSVYTHLQRLLAMVNYDPLFIVCNDSVAYVNNMALMRVQLTLHNTGTVFGYGPTVAIAADRAAEQAIKVMSKVLEFRPECLPVHPFDEVFAQN